MIQLPKSTSITTVNSWSRFLFSILFIILLVILLAIFLILLGVLSFTYILIIAITLFTIVMTCQGIFSLFLMLYAWEDMERSEKDKSPEIYIEPKLSFTALVPARHEENVIGDTMRAIDKIDYPEELKEIIMVCRSDDLGTISAVNRYINNLEKSNIKLVIFDTFPINKPHGLNIGLKHATKKVICIFDAEDQPHKDIYNIINTTMIEKEVDVVQSGVQLMNFRSSWFSTLNVLEYFFWFKSTLHYFAKQGIIPLGGNTVFFKKYWLDKVGGWDETCLTEDADIGIRLSLLGAKTQVVYDEKHTTQEETPPDFIGFLKQRTRWNQGFIQIMLKGDWLKLPKISQRFLAGYILILPQVQAALFIFMPISIIMAFFLKLPVIVAILTIIPMGILLLQLITYNIGLFEFTKGYNLKYPFFMPLKVLYTFYFFQIALGIGALWASIRMLQGDSTWEKTTHINAHRENLEFTLDYMPLRNQA